MRVYIALLRGINVGGKNQISMAMLKEAMATAGLQNVVTYINSGNVLFSSDQSEDALRAMCEAVIMERFGLPIPVVILSADALFDALAHAPEWWNAQGDGIKHNAIFAIPPATSESIREAVGDAKPEYEQVAHHGPVIFWSAPIQTFSRARWASLPKLPAFLCITVRNANTTLKLAQLAEKAKVESLSKKESGKKTMWQCPKCGRTFEKSEQDHYCTPISDIDAYIDEQPEAVRPILSRLREVIHNAAPDATEKISWRMPTFWQRENLIHFAAFKRHIGIYPGDEAVAAFTERLTEYKTSKGAIQIPLDKPIDYELVAEITRWRVEKVAKKG